MKSFFEDFKKFITRGNVVDMAVGVTVGSAFTAVVNGFTNNIIKPLINFVIAIIVGDGALTDAFTFLKKAYVPIVDEAGAITGYTSEVDLANSIYIDWGAFINAIINFLLIAFVLFCIVRLFNRFRDNHEKLSSAIKNGKASKEERKEMKALGLNYRSYEELSAFREKKAKEAEEAAAAAAAAEQAAKDAADRAVREAKEAEEARLAREEALLTEIRDLLRAKS